MPPRLHERDRETAVIVTALDAVAAGRGGAVVVEGPAGIGKTSLLEPAGTGRGARPRRGERARIRPRGRVRLGRRPAAARATPARHDARRSRPDAQRRGRARRAGRAPRRHRGAGEADAAFGVLHGLYWLVAALAASARRCCVVDDLHWADAASVRFLEFLANRLDAVPVLLRQPSAAGRVRGGAPAWDAARDPDGAGRSRRSRPAAVLAERDGVPVAAALAAACHDATGGNPLLVRRLADGLGDHDDPAAVARTVRTPWRARSARR